jgi:hypothetical protein
MKRKLFWLLAAPLTVIAIGLLTLGAACDWGMSLLEKFEDWAFDEPTKKEIDW